MSRGRGIDGGQCNRGEQGFFLVLMVLFIFSAVFIITISLLYVFSRFLNILGFF